MYYQPEIETIKRSELQKLQVKRLKRSIDIALHSPFYAKILGEKGITSDSISIVEDIRKLPFTTKADLREYYPFGLVATDMKNVVRLHSSSGTTGNPTVICHSQHDLDQWANRVARCHVYGRHTEHRCISKYIRIRYVYRRTRISIRSRTFRSSDSSCSSGK